MKVIASPHASFYQDQNTIRLQPPSCPRDDGEDNICHGRVSNLSPQECGNGVAPRPLEG